MNYTYVMICINLQTVTLPVGMEELVVVHIPMLTATVPEGTKVHIASLEVRMHTPTSLRAAIGTLNMHCTVCSYCRL